MNVFGNLFGAKKEEPPKNDPSPQISSTNNTFTSEGTPQSAGGDANLFGGFMQVKRKKSITLDTKPAKAFDPFSMPSTTQNDSRPNPGFQTSQTMPAEHTTSSFSGHNSLNRIEDDENASNLAAEPQMEKKKSAFNFIQKSKPQTNDVKPAKFNPFAMNTAPTTNNNTGRNDLYDAGPLNTTGSTEQDMQQDSQATAAPKGNAFSFLHKKKQSTVPAESDAYQQQIQDNQTVNSSMQASINLDASIQNEMESAAGFSDTKSDTLDAKNVSTPPAKASGPSFMKFKTKPGTTADPFKQKDKDSEAPLPTMDTSQVDRGSESGSAVSTGGPSFLRFKQKSDQDTNQSNQPPIRAATEEPVKNTFTGRSTKSNLSESPKDFNTFMKNRPHLEETPEHHIRHITTERITSPLQAVETPAVGHQENPEGIKDRLESEKSNIIEAVGDLILRQNGLMGKKNSLESQKDTTSKKLKSVANRQNQAIESDNFEEADQLEVVIVQLNETLKELEKQIDDTQLENADLEREKQSLYQNQFMLYKHFIIDIDNTMLTQHHNHEKYKLECINQQNTEKLYIDEKTKELQYSRNHIDLDLKHINEETKQVQESMDKQIKDFVADQKNFSERKADLVITVERIRRELEERERELAEVTGNLNKVESKISTVKSKFADQLNRIKKTREKADAEEEKYQEDVKRLQAHQDKVDHNGKRLEEVMENFTKMSNGYMQLRSQFEKESDKLNKVNMERDTVIRFYFESLNDLRQEKSQLSNCDDEIDKLKENLERFQREVNNLVSQKNSLENKIPELEKEKKGFVASRSFKDASRVSNDIKEIQTKISEIEERFNQVSESERQTNHGIDTLEKETVPSLKARVEVTSRNCDIKKHALLKVKEDDLSSILEYYNSHRQYEEGNLIETELRLTQQQLVELQNQYPELQPKAVDEGEHQTDELLVGDYGHVQLDDHEEQNADNNNHDDNLFGLGDEQVHAEPEEQNNNEVDAPLNAETDVEVKNELSLEDLVREYEKLQTKIVEADALIDQYAAEEKYNEADEAASQQETWRTRQADIMEHINGLGHLDLEQAKAALSQVQTQNVEEEPEQDLLNGEHEEQNEKADAAEEEEEGI